MSPKPFQYNPVLHPAKWWTVYKSLLGTWPARLTVASANLTGKWILITGGNNGIGREAAVQFAHWGANIIIAARDPPPYEIHPTATVEDCIAAAKSAGHDSTIEWWPIDCAKLSTITAMADRYLTTNRPLDILVNNAGLPGSPVSKTTEDGFQLVHQVNFLCHVLLTVSLLPAISKAASPRVICVTSCEQYNGVFDLSNINEPEGSYPNNKLYFQTWLTEMQKRCLANDRYKHVRICGVHPGFVKSGIWTTTPLGSLPDLKLEDSWMLRAIKMVLDNYAIDTQQGSIAITTAATGTEMEDSKSGLYFNRVWRETPMPQTIDESCQREIWDAMGRALRPFGWEKLAVGLEG